LGKVVWFSTFDSENQVKFSKENRPFVSVVKNGQLVPEAKEVIALAAKNGLMIETGHSSPAEGLMIVKEAKRQGAQHVVVTHAMSPVVGMTTDGALNRWVATHQALYLMRPGEKTFHRYDARDGLHLAANPVTYCDTWAPHPSCLSGAAVSPGITEIAGGGTGEVFVGYAGHDDGTEDFDDPNRHTGKLDRVRVDGSGAITVQRLDLVNSTTAQFWHNRTVQRLVYDRARKELYVGTNHGIDRLQPDRYRDPKPGEWFLNVTHEWLSDHLHPRVCFHAACTGDESKDDQRMGDWRGVALAPDGDLWVAGKWTAGKIRWTSDLSAWHDRPGHEAYAFNFGDPYNPSSGANPPSSSRHARATRSR
jgi:hypothetical protein